ncbi:MAG: FAD-binding protein [Pleomorphochaeta sp.]
MKNLIILHVGGKNNLDIVLRQHKALKSLSENIGFESDTYIYFSDSNLDFLGKFFCGNVFFQKYEFLSPSLVSQEILLLENIEKYNGIIIAEDDFANELSVLIAKSLNYQCVTNVQNIISDNENLLFTRFSYNNNLLADFLISDKYVISLRGYKYNKFIELNEELNLKEIEVTVSNDYILDSQLIQNADDLIESDILIAVGMGVNSKQEIDNIRSFSQINGFSFGVSRPIAMRGWGTLSEIIGVSGNIFSPKICITIGVSGAAAFYVGIENSEYILSINVDEDASIISLSNSNIIEDYKKVLPSIFTYLKELN